MQNKTNQEYLSEILKYAVQQGYSLPALERAIFVDNTQPLEGSLDTWARGIITDPEFAKSVFGSNSVSSSGSDFAAIRFWAKQVAVEHLGKIIKVDTERPYVEVYTPPEIDIDYDTPKAPTELLNVERTTLEIRHLAASIPIRTHELQKVEVATSVSSWQYHLQELVISDNPYKYVADYIKSLDPK